MFEYQLIFLVFPTILKTNGLNVRLQNSRFKTWESERVTFFETIFFLGSLVSLTQNIYFAEMLFKHCRDLEIRKSEF